ncbi:hypothetical protein ACNFNZ_12515 [Empedobacter brevis]|uniref:hypothetical protein n=1 Tax=Empedobacter brevis TaxID=247 RepID=UPI0023F2419D|nr:hypothetical protein [Empedobacter brevis]
MISIEEKYQYGNLCDALCRNLNDNFMNVSFEIFENGDIQCKFILLKFSNREEEYIEDIMAEFTALQTKDCVLKPIIEIGNEKKLKNIVYNNIG